MLIDLYHWLLPLLVPFGAIIFYFTHIRNRDDSNSLKVFFFYYVLIVIILSLVGDFYLHNCDIIFFSEIFFAGFLFGVLFMDIYFR